MKNYEEYEKALESLGIVSRFTLGDLKNNYLKLSKKYHPDMQQGDAEKFKEINEAYQTLKDEKKRAEYNRLHNIN